MFAGVNVIFYYSSVPWPAAGFSAKNPADNHRHHEPDEYPTALAAPGAAGGIDRQKRLPTGSAGMFHTLGSLAIALQVPSRPVLLGGTLHYRAGRSAGRPQPSASASRTRSHPPSRDRLIWHYLRLPARAAMAPAGAHHETGTKPWTAGV